MLQDAIQWSATKGCSHIMASTVLCNDFLVTGYKNEPDMAAGTFIVPTQEA